jgi:glyoxylate reductase
MGRPSAAIMAHPMRPRIFVPQPIPAHAVARLERMGELATYPHLDRHISAEEVLDAARSAEILFGLSGIRYDRAVIEAASNLRLIAAMHMNPTFVDVTAATGRGIPVAGIPNMLVETTAEFTFALLLATAWRLPEADRFVREGRWTQNQSMAFLATRVFDKTVGILGLGEIGALVAARAGGCGMRVLYTKRTRLGSDEETRMGVSYRSLDDLFSESDIVVVTTALTAQTKGLVGVELLSRMKPTAMIINTSRGPVVDEAALEAALREGRIAGAGLDVFEREVPDPDAGPRPGLLELPNVVLTPHMGSAAAETRSEMANRAVDNIEAFLRGERPPDLLNPEVYGGESLPNERIG